jgi:thiosulfate dehydrogenase
MNQFVKFTSLLVALLCLTVAVVSTIGFLNFLANTGVHFPARSSSSDTVPTSIDAPKSKPLADPAAVWRAPDWDSVDQDPNAASIKYGREG